MGLTKRLQNKRVYLDTNIFIYLLEGSEDFTNSLSEIQALIADNAIQVTSSELVFTEILPFHVKKNDFDAIKHIIKFLDNFNIVSITRTVTIQAGILRGEFSNKTPDALHIATALEQQCEIFLTNDKGIKTPKELRRVILSDL